MEKGFLLDKEMLELFSGLDESTANDLIDSLGHLKIEERVITKGFFSKNIEKIQNMFVAGKSRMVIEKFFVNLGYSRTEVEEVEGVEMERDIKIISSPRFFPRKIGVQDFVSFFRGRYEQIRNILRGRDLENLTSIRRIGENKDNYSVIVSILSKRITRNKNLLLEVEDLTGRARILINQNKEEVFSKAKDLMLDDIVAFQVSGDSEWLYANDVIFPDAFLTEKRRHDKEIFVAFTSDFHIGSTMFLEDNLKKFISWLNGETGEAEQRKSAKNVKYLFLTGDNVDGIGVYPTQEKFLNIKDFKSQYNKLAEILKMIRKDVKIIICPGQHDAVWVGHPQPTIGEDWAPELYKMENVFLVPNPCLVEIDGGFKILMYHGAGMHDFVSEIEDIRLNYGHESPTRVVKEILKRRHLSPSHGSADYIPTEKKDSLVIDILPDIITTGDWHRADVGVYNNILMIAGSCWQSITPFEEKVGNNPDPCKVPILNLKTREIKILDFSGNVEEKEEYKEKGEEIIGEVKDGKSN